MKVLEEINLLKKKRFFKDWTEVLTYKPRDFTFGTPSAKLVNSLKSEIMEGYHV